MNAKKIDRTTGEAVAMVGAAARLLSGANTAAQDTAMSAEMEKCIQALEWLNVLTEVANARCVEIGPQADGKTFAQWAETRENTLEYQQAQQWAEAAQQAVFALENCVRTAPCRTIGDIAAKMKFGGYFASFKDSDTHEDYSEESLQLVRSIAAMFQQDASQAADKGAPLGRRRSANAHLGEIVSP